MKLIFQNHWKDYLKTHKVREVEKQEVEKMLSCKGAERGCFVFYCKRCDRYEIIPFGCNSRLCSCCGKRYTDKWAVMLTEKIMPKIVHRHMTFSMPEILWGYIKENRSLQKIIMNASYLTIKEMFSSIAGKEIMPGVISVLHPFGKDLLFKPHPHCIVTEGGFDGNGTFISIGRYIHYDTFHKKWQYCLLNSLRKYIPRNIIDYCFNHYPNGFCAYVKPERIKSSKRLIEYIGRYVRHPAIANSRIEVYNGEAVKFYYEDHEKKIHHKIMLVNDFISAVIQHIPEKNQRLVRYYGAYSRKKIKKIKKEIKQSSLIYLHMPKTSKKRVAYCSLCFQEMEFVAYLRKPPPKDKSKITTWIDSLS